MKKYLSLAQLNSALSLRDLSDPAAGPHAMQLLLADVVAALERLWAVPSRTHRLNPLVATADNYDRLAYSPDDVTRNSRYSRHVSPTVMLRSHTSAGIPALLDSLRGELGHYDELHVLPGLVYRRDAIDRTHVGAPHQLDLWRLKARGLLGTSDLEAMMAAVVEAVLPAPLHPDVQWRATPARHSYTAAGRQLDVLVTQPDGRREWLELAECGLVAAPVLRGSGLDPRRWAGLALGMGLDRALMLRKGITDIRLLRSGEPEVQSQMLDLSPYRPVSALPEIRRDLSLVLDSGADADVELLGDLARTALGSDADVLAALEVVAVTTTAELPPAAVERLRMGAGQVNVLLRLVLQPLDRTLTDREANVLRDRVYLALHRGEALELIAG
ncbi:MULTISPECIES: PheS-related mystery ligase SrmL [unclassified Pseudarthrobacter]|uniref:PheS-related mystery ligase SrmL n=1 Tax=unclassified Pseudarthrobacter TaxID=2647000 RepID=UPI003077B49B